MSQLLARAIVSLVLVISSLIPFVAVRADDASTCTVQAGTFSVSGSTISIPVTLSGAFNGCDAQISLTTWHAPNGTDGQPADQQTLFSSVTTLYGQGNYTFTTSLPTCYYEAYLAIGENTATAGGPNLDPASILATSNGGDQACPQSSVAPSTGTSSQTTGGLGGGATTQPQTGADLFSAVGTAAVAGAAYWLYYVKKKSTKEASKRTFSQTRV